MLGKLDDLLVDPADSGHLLEVFIALLIGEHRQELPAACGDIVLILVEELKRDRQELDIHRHLRLLTVKGEPEAAVRPYLQVLIGELPIR